MRGYGLYLAKRLLQFALVVFIGINVTYLITHATPIDPVEQTITAATAFGTTSPEAIAMMRASLQDLYGTGGGALHQWLAFWGRIVVGDFGPSLSAFPTPVSTLIRRALPPEPRGTLSRAVTPSGTPRAPRAHTPRARPTAPGPPAPARRG